MAHAQSSASAGRRANGEPRTELGVALAACRGAFVGTALMSLMLNLLYLTGSFFMLEVYDRVIPGRSVPTLVGLAIIATTLYAFQGVLDILRGRVLARVGVALDESLSGRIYDVLTRLPLKTRGTDGMQPLRDLDSVRAFLSGSGPGALFDLPWMPLYLAICYLFHPLIGIAATVGALILIVITFLTERFSRAPVHEAAGHGAQRAVLAEASRRNAEVLQAMGMAGRVGAAWREVNGKYMASNLRSSDIAGGFGATSKVLRMLLQSAVLGIGAYLVIHQEASGGIIIASSIITSRALAPVELAIANWRGFVGARQGWKHLSDLLAKLPALDQPMPLPKPTAMLSLEAVSVCPPGVNALVVQDATFKIEAGRALGIIGPSASGKSSLARAIVGAWQPLRGKIRLDNASLDQWSPELLGPHIGYLPQGVELFAGSIAQNIARFELQPDPPKVIAAAVAAGVHEMILRLPNGYETQIGEFGAALSAGQRQRVGLARALYGDPFLIVLDEPNSNLDADGDDALTQAILHAKQRGSVLIVIAHRPSALIAVDLVLMMNEGKIQAFGPKDEVLGKILRPVAAKQASASAPLRIVKEGSVAAS
jgi:ATP-binding cassette subfamily C protein